MIDIIVANLIFWPVYLYICTIPHRLVQSVIDNEGDWFALHFKP